MKTHTKQNTPTAYGFACGYVQTEESNGNSKQLYKEHGVYHLRMFRGSERVIWLSYDKLEQARRDFKNTSLN